MTEKFNHRDHGEHRENSHRERLDGNFSVALCAILRALSGKKIFYMPV
jgi:hypothetical protein